MSFLRLLRRLRYGPNGRMATQLSLVPWNDFIASIMIHELSEIDVEKRPAFLIFWYCAEVNNGGHLQYFLNRAQDPFEETIKAIEDLGAFEAAQRLRQAVSTWQTQELAAPNTTEDYISQALEGAFEAYDRAFYADGPQLDRILEKSFQSRFCRLYSPSSQPT